MRLGEKLRYLREVEGTLRGREGALTQAEVVRLLQKELRETISQAYLSQIESGARPHLTNSSRMLLAKFFKVHPGYLVDDPGGISERADVRRGRAGGQAGSVADQRRGAFPRRRRAEPGAVAVARHEDSRMCLVLLGAILDNPGLAERLLQVLKPAPAPRRRRLCPNEEAIAMTWADFYLICFLLGLALSLLSVLAGSAHLHLPHVHVPGCTFRMCRGCTCRMCMRRAAEAEGVPWFNFGTITAFLAWFGGTGYLLERYYAVWFVVALAIAMLSGLGGAAIVFWFLSKLARMTQALDPADYDMVGVLGKLSIPIREGGTGEMIFSQEGMRRVTGARSEDGTAIPKGAEVVVTRYEKGIAYVRRWEDLAGSAEDLAVKQGQ